MENKDKHNEARIDNEILFSKTVKAGKRVYYIDVKRDRKGEFYISMTESKRVKDSENSLHPTFENIRYSSIAKTWRSFNQPSMPPQLTHRSKSHASTLPPNGANPKLKLKLRPKLESTRSTSNSEPSS